MIPSAPLSSRAQALISCPVFFPTRLTLSVIEGDRLFRIVSPGTAQSLMFLEEKTYSQNWIWTGAESQLTVQQRDASKILIDWGRVGSWDVELGTWNLIHG